MDETEVTPRQSEAPNSEGTDEGVGEDTASDTVSTGSESDEDDPFEVAYRARLELEQERMREQAMAEAEARIREQWAQARAQATSAEERRRITEAFTDAIKTSRENLKKLSIKDMEGNEYGLTDEQIEEYVVKPFQAYNASAQQSISQTVYNQLAEVAFNALPPEAQQEFSQRAANRPLDEWLRAYAESLAPHTDFAKKLKKEHEVAIKAAEAKALAKRMPPGSPSQGAGRPAPKGNVDLSSHSGAARALADGLISTEQYLEARRKLESQ